MLDSVLLILLLSDCVACYFFTVWLIKYAEKNNLKDIPNKRSSHITPTPRGGGASIAISTVLFFTIFIFISGIPLTIGLLTFLISSGGIAILGWYDDRKNLSRTLRFAVQAIAAILAIVFIAVINKIYVPGFGLFEIGLLGIAGSFLWITGMANIYNFMDGIDGIAAVQGIGAALGWIFLGYIWEVQELIILNLFILVAVSVFLIFNWSPAKIFMGDVGSLFLGFSFAVMPLIASNFSDSLLAGQTIWFGILLLWPFIFDGTFTIFKRLGNKENIFEAHRTHLYQRLNVIGWSHSNITLLYSFFFGCSIFSAILFLKVSSIYQYLLLCLMILSSTFFAIWVSRKEKNIKKS